MPGPKNKDPKQNQKNKPKDENGGGWCIDDLYFDEEGCVYVANKDLADAIQSSLDAWKGHLTIYRDPRPGEKPNPAVRARAIAGMERPGAPLEAMLKSGSDAGIAGTEATDRTATMMKGSGPTTTTSEEADPKVNMMCPCAPEQP
jgi:hypothetical protein